MKKMLATFLAILIACTMSAMGETLTIDLDSATDAELLAARDAIMLELASRTPANGQALLTCEIRGCTVTLTAAKLANGRQGEAGVAFFFDFANGTDAVAAFQQYVWVQTYQNGVECPSIWVDGTDSADRATKVQPGGTSTDADWGFALTDPDGIIEVQICDVGDWRKPVVATITLDLKQLQ